MATHPKRAEAKRPVLSRNVAKKKVAEPVRKDGQWRVKCYKCGILPESYGNWTKAATGAWRHGKH